MAKSKSITLFLSESRGMKPPLVPFLFTLFFVGILVFFLSYDRVDYNLLPNLLFDGLHQQQAPAGAPLSAAEEASKCDLFSGRWVLDNSIHPLYSGLGCTYMHDEVACEKYGRRDLKHQQWRWQPHACNLPRSVSPYSCAYK